MAEVPSSGSAADAGPAAAPAQARTSAAAPRARAWLRWAALSGLLLAAIIIPFLLFEEQLTGWTGETLRALAARPWLGAGLVVALLAGDAVLPVPSSILSAFAGGIFGWRLGWLVIWTGMTLGCVVSYGLGARAGRGVGLRIVGLSELERARRLFTDVGPAALVVTRAVPVLGEAATLVAGAARMPFALFMLSTGAANAVVAAAYAGVGAAAMSSGSFLLTFLGLVSLPALAWGAWRLMARRRRAQPQRSSA